MFTKNIHECSYTLVNARKHSWKLMETVKNASKLLMIGTSGNVIKSDRDKI